MPDKNVKRKIAYLTIDDCPTEDMAEKADFLLARNIPAVWFCVGSHIEKYMDNVLYAINKGFVIGNHTYSHKLASAMSLKTAFSEIKKTDEIIDLVYQKTGKERPARLFRFPYGNKGGESDDFRIPLEQDEKKSAIQDYLKKLGYVQGKFPGISYEYMNRYGLLEDVDWYWTFDTMDWALNRPDKPCGIDRIEKIFDKIDSDRPDLYEGLNSGSSEEIILLHDQPGTKQVFMDIVDKLLTKNLEFRMPEFEDIT